MGTEEAYKARKRADETQKDKKKWWFNQGEPIDQFTGWLVAWTALLFVATICSVVVLLITDRTFNEQLGVMRGQLLEMQSAGRQTDDLIEANKKLVELYRRLVDATQTSAGAAKDSAEVARQALVNAQRAFVFINNITQRRITTSDNTDTTMWVFHVEFKNSGNTPTKVMTFRLNIRAFDGELPADFDFADNPGGESAPGFIAPQGTVGVPDLGASVEDIEAVIAGRKTLFIWGWIRYEDLFDNTPIHWVEYADEILIVGEARADRNLVEHRLYRRHNGHYDAPR